MLSFERDLTPTEVKWKLLSVPESKKKYFPGPSEQIIVYDEKRRRYIARMHSTVARIQGLTGWYKNHPGARIGEGVVIRVNQDKSIKLSLKKEEEIYTEEEHEEEPSEIEIPPDTERQVEDFLEKNVEKVEEGLKLYYNKNNRSGRQYLTSAGIIDLLCVDEDKNFVIIEIKKEKGSDKTIGQITRYMGWVKENLAGDRKVRGIIIANKVDEKLEYSASVLSNIDIKYYKIELKFVSKEELSEK